MIQQDDHERLDAIRRLDQLITWVKDESVRHTRPIADGGTRADPSLHDAVALVEEVERLRALMTPQETRPKVITDLLAVDDTGVVANYIRRLEARLAVVEPLKAILLESEMPQTDEALIQAARNVVANEAFYREGGAERPQPPQETAHETDRALHRRSGNQRAAGRSGVDVVGAALAADVDVHEGPSRAPDSDHPRANTEVAERPQEN